jgi:hypothetical protein
MSSADEYLSFYVNSLDARGLGGNYKRIRVQRGDGLGSFLSGAFRRLFPILTSGAKAVGEQILNTGLLLLRDGINGKDMKESVRERVNAAGNNLSKRAAANLGDMVGNGLKPPRKRKKAQSNRGRKRQNTSKRKRDIFA